MPWVVTEETLELWTMWRLEYCQDFLSQTKCILHHEMAMKLEGANVMVWMRTIHYKSVYLNTKFPVTGDYGTLRRCSLAGQGMSLGDSFECLWLCPTPWTFWIFPVYRCNIVSQLPTHAWLPVYKCNQPASSCHAFLAITDTLCLWNQKPK